MREARAFLRHAIKRRSRHLATVTTHIAPAKIIRENDKDVGLTLRRAPLDREEATQGRNQQRSHQTGCYTVTRLEEYPVVVHGVSIPPGSKPGKNSATRFRHAWLCPL